MGSADFEDSENLAERGPSRSTSMRWIVESEEQQTTYAKALVIATPMPEALRFLGQALGDDHLGEPFIDAHEYERVGCVESVTFVVRLEGAAGLPHRDRVFVSTQARGTGARMFTDLSARWDWVAHAAGDNCRVLRLHYDRKENPASTGSLDDETMETLARHDAAALWGIPLTKIHVEAFARTHVKPPPPAGLIGHKQRVEDLRERIAQEPTLHVTGAWFGGVDLADVIGDAEKAANDVSRLADTPA